MTIIMDRVKKVAGKKMIKELAGLPKKNKIKLKLLFKKRFSDLLY